MSLDRRLVWFLRVLLAVLICSLLVDVIGRSSLARAFANTDWERLPLVYLAACAGIVTNAVVLQHVLRCAGLVVGLRRVLLAKSLGTFYTLVLPGEFFGGAAKWADLSAATGDKTGVLSSLVLVKVALAMPPLLVGSVALAVDNPLEQPALAAAAIVMAGLVVSGMALVLYPPTGRRLAVLMTRVLHRMPLRLHRPGERLLASVIVFHQLRPANYLLILGLSFCVFALAIVAMYLAAVAVGVIVPIAALFWINLILFITRLLPLTIGNLGVRESVLAAAFGLYGVSPASAVLVGLLMFSSMVFVGLLGGAYQLAIATGWVQWRGGPAGAGRTGR